MNESSMREHANFATQGFTTIPLFPLKSVLFPNGRLPMQIFEQRYIDLVSRSLRQDKGFGICLLKDGDEVVQAGKRQQVHRVGTYARIVDWDKLPNGLLGITVEGSQKFTVHECWSDNSQLLMAKVVFSDTDRVGEPLIPVDDSHEALITLAQQLASHPAIESLNLQLEFENLREIAWRLSELIPLSLETKQELLELNDTQERVNRIEALIASMAEQG
jgi:Lon protease-like protein